MLRRREAPKDASPHPSPEPVLGPAKGRTRGATPSPSGRRDSRREFPFWLLAAILLAILFFWLIVADNDYRIIFRALRRGVLTTLWVTIVAFALAAALGLLVALGRVSRFRLLREVTTFYVEILRGIPVLVLLFYVAFVGAPGIVRLWNWAFGWPIDAGILPPLTVRDFDLTWRAIFALTISYSAYLAEIFRAGIEAVPKGHLEAAWSLGLSRPATFRFIVLPQAIRVVLPPLGNDFVAMIKDSALVSALGVQDITQLGKVYSASTFLFFETYNVVAFLYLVMTLSLSLLVRALETRLKRKGEAVS
jgi:polar amino acid transport system permease protein